jgi:hypothetical protein
MLRSLRNHWREIEILMQLSTRRNQSEKSVLLMATARAIEQ